MRRDEKRELIQIIKQLEKANKALSECGRVIESLEKECIRGLNDTKKACTDAASWEKKYRELYTKYINLLRKRG